MVGRAFPDPAFLDTKSYSISVMATPTKKMQYGLWCSVGHVNAG